MPPNRKNCARWEINPQDPCTRCDNALRCPVVAQETREADARHLELAQQQERLEQAMIHIVSGALRECSDMYHLTIYNQTAPEEPQDGPWPQIAVSSPRGQFLITVEHVGD